MFLQENLNQKKTASFKDIGLELLEDIIIFNEQFEQLKYEVCLTENALVIASGVNNSKPEEKESLLKRMGDGAKKIWAMLLEILKKIKDKVLDFFSKIINIFKAGFYQGRIQTLGNLLDKIIDENENVRVAHRKINIKYVLERFNKLASEQINNVDNTRFIELTDKITQQIEGGFQTIDKEYEEPMKDQSFATAFRDMVFIKTVKDSLQSFSIAKSTVEKNILELENKVKVLQSQNNEAEVDSIRKKINVYHKILFKIVNYGTKTIIAIGKVVDFKLLKEGESKLDANHNDTTH